MIKLIEIQPFPCIDYINFLIDGLNVEIVIYDNFSKSSFRNRYIIAGANGLTHLTIPVAGGREQKTLITDIQIDRSTNWADKHWRSITSAYKKAPYFEFYEEEVREMVFNKDSNLFNFNLFIITNLCKCLKINSLVAFAKEKQCGPEELVEVVDCRNRFLPSNFQQNRENWQPRYSQVFEDRLGFQPNLSILDLLFCEGPNARNLLQNRGSVR